MADLTEWSAEQAASEGQTALWLWSCRNPCDDNYVLEKDGGFWAENRRPRLDLDARSTVSAPSMLDQEPRFCSTLHRRALSVDGDRVGLLDDPDERSHSDDDTETIRSLSPPRTASRACSSSSSPVVASQMAPRAYETALDPKAYETALDPRFQFIEKPRRFFTVGRIFKTVWFEPGVQQEAEAAAGPPNRDWTAACPPFHDEKPVARFRWFVVVRRRLHHSLCFPITTISGERTNPKVSRGRACDFVVLYLADFAPPEPWPEEKTDRRPLAVVMEEPHQHISPTARVDCARIYTVENNLKVMKIGRIHPDSLNDLEQYYGESAS